MAFSVSNDYLTGRKPVPTPAETDITAVRFSLSLATADLALNTIGNIGILPAGYVPVGIILDSDDLDSNVSPTITWDIGVSNAAVSNGVQGTGVTAISTATADGGAAWTAAASNISQAGGQVQLYSKPISRVTPTAYDRYVVLKATAGAATAAAGEVGLTLLYRAAQ